MQIDSIDLLPLVTPSKNVEPSVKKTALLVDDTQLSKSISGDYYPWFDWLRLAASSTVLLSHQGLINGWREAGNFSVQVFFALSGWLIGGILVNLRKDELPRFFFNRALRIWVPYFLALALLVSASLMRDRVTSKWAEVVFYKATSVYNLFGLPQVREHKAQMPLDGTGSHFWSVNAEEQFYLLAPLILVVAAPAFGRRVITWCAIALLAWVTGTYASIVFGVLAAILVNTYGAFHTRPVARFTAGMVVSGSILGYMAVGYYRLLAPICAIALVMLLAVQGKRHPVGELAGGMSYPLYLNAWIAIFVINAASKQFQITNRFAHQALILAFSFLIAAVLYWQVDRRILTSRGRLYTPGRARVAMAFAYGAVAVGIVVGIIVRCWA